MTVSPSGLAWGVVGTGDISRFVCSDLALLDSARLIGVASRSLHTARSFAAEFGFQRSYSGLDRMLADDDIDIVYIGTPHATHLPLAVAALQAGKHVLIEKPIGLNATEARTIQRAAQDAGLFAMEAMWTKFSPVYRELLRSIREGAIGEVRSVNASFGLPFDTSDAPRWSAERASSSLLDQGIYPVTLALDVLGPPARIHAAQVIRDDGVDLSVRLTFEYSEGRFAHLAASMVEYADPSASVSGTEGWVRVPAPFWAPKEFSTHAGSIPTALFSPTVTTFPAEGFGYLPMLRAVTEAINAGQREHPEHTLDTSIETFVVLDRIRTAARAELVSTDPIPTAQL